MSLSETVGAAGLAFYAEAALVLFLVAFVLVLIQVARTRVPAALDEASRLPLADDDAASSHPITRETSEALRHGH